MCSINFLTLDFRLSSFSLLALIADSISCCLLTSLSHNVILVVEFGFAVVGVCFGFVVVALAATLMLALVVLRSLHY